MLFSGCYYSPRRLFTNLLLSLALLPCVFSSSLAEAEDRNAEGAALFADKGCSHCHGINGFGGSDSGPDLSRVRKELKPAEITQQIHDGGNNMPPFADTLSDGQIQSLVVYLRSRRRPPPGYVKQKPVAPAPARPVSADPE